MKFLNWLKATVVGLAKAAKVHVAIVIAVLLWASQNMQDPQKQWATVALSILGVLGVYQAPRAYGTTDAPVDQIPRAN